MKVGVELDNAWRCELLWGPGEVIERLGGTSSERRGRLGSAAAMAPEAGLGEWQGEGAHEGEAGGLL